MRDVLTYYDIVQRLALRMGFSPEGREVQMLRIAVVDAYRDLPSKHNWKYYTRQLTFRTTGTSSLQASYDHTGGAYERLLTATTSVFTPNHVYGSLRNANATFEIERYISGTQVVLSASNNPGVDIASSSWVFSRSSYNLPFPIKQVSEIWTADGTRSLSYVPTSELGSETQLFDEASEPWRFTLQASRALSGGTDVRLIPPPSTAETYVVTCDIRPWSLKTYEISGTDGSTDSTSTFTSAGASFTSSLVGCVIRISGSSSLPKEPNEYSTSRQDFVFQSCVRRVISATQLELYDAVPFTASSRGYSISDPVDLSHASMLSYFEALCSEKFCYNNDIKKLPIAKAISQEEIMSAVIADSSVNWNIQGAIMPWMYQPGDLGTTDMSSLV